MAPVWPKRISSLPLLDQSLLSKGLASMSKPPQYITIAISGCSSSGKSTLALLLQEIFSTSTRRAITPSLTLNESSSNLADKGKGEHKIAIEYPLADHGRGRAIVAHQDAFFLDKSHCPNVTFRSTLNDLEFVEQTLLNDTIGTYTLEKPEPTHPNDSPTKAMTLNYKVTGADTDCWQAIDAPSMVASIKELRESGSLTSLRQRYEVQEKLLPGLLITKAETEGILASNTELIDEMREAVKSWVEERSASNREFGFGGLNIREGLISKGGQVPKFLIVEGFLLFPDPNLHGSREESASDTSDPFFTPKNGLVIPDEGANINYHTAYISAYESLNATARQALMSQFDIKLFLPTSNGSARTRRFNRDLYIDAPEGKRYPGQMWKTEGYFNDVAWANYVRECGWLMERNGVETSREAVREGVHVRPGADMGVQDTVRWAVDVVLGVLGSQVRDPPAVVLGEGAEDLESVEGREKGVKSAVLAKLSTLKTRFLNIVRFGSKERAHATSATATDAKPRDVGLKTVLGSELQNTGFFSPKMEHRP